MQDPLATKDYENFDQWWQSLLKLALEVAHDLVGRPEHYQEYYDDGDTPEEALDLELEAALIGDEEE